MDTRASTQSADNADRNDDGDKEASPPSGEPPTDSEAMREDRTKPASTASANANANANANAYAPTPTTEKSDADPNTSTAESATNAATSTTVARRRRGHRATSSVWRILTLDPSPHLAISSVCRHCGARVPHHHKSEKVRAHLTRCVVFRQALATAEARDDPALKWLADPVRANASNESSTNSPYRPPPPSNSLTATTKRLKPTIASSSSSISPSSDPLAVMDALAMYIYTTGSAFSHIENPHLRRAIALASGSPAPSPERTVRAEDLTGLALDRAFAAVQCKLLRVTQRAGAVNTLCVNSWLPSTSESVYVVGDTRSTKAPPLFVDAAPRADDPHVLFDRLARALPLCGDNIHGVVTDNSHANQRTWAKFKTIFPAKFFHGCAAHGLYLFVEEIFGPTPLVETSDTEAPPTTATTPAFADLRRLVEACREMIAFLHGEEVSRVVKASLSTKLSNAGGKQLEMPPPGQWFKLKVGFESVLVVLPLLQKLTKPVAFVDNGDSITKPQRQRFATLVNQPELETLLFKAVALVDPLDTLLLRLEQDPATPISDVFYWFAKELPVALSRVPGLSDDEATFLLKVNQNRFNAMYGDSHGMAYLLDPRYVGEGLSADVRKNIEDLIFQAPLVDTAADKDADSEEDKIAIAQQLTEYVIDATKEKADNSFRYTLLAKHKKSVLQYWLSDGLQWPLLQKLATRLFALPPSTLPMSKKVLSVPLRLPPSEDLSEVVVKKIKFIQLNQALLNSAVAVEPNDGVTQ